jgi:predicted transcriptional regulator
MRVRDEFIEIVKEIVEHEKEFKMSPRTFLGYFFCFKRTKGNNGRIDAYLQEQNLETIPNYINVYMDDAEMTLKHKPKATSKTEPDPIQRINILPSANKTPITINRDARLNDAITLMMMNNFSQLPVMSSPKSVAGFISWNSIGEALSNGATSDQVKDFLITDFTIVPYDTPLLEAIKTVIQKEFVLVQKKDKVFSGIVTIADISSQFLTLTEPFLLLEQIESLIRLLLNGKFLVEDLSVFNEQESSVTIECIDDLTFGQYINLIEKRDNWDKLGLTIDRVNFIKELHIVREIRNDIMHFDPEGITPKHKEVLVNMANFLTSLKKYQKHNKTLEEKYACPADL